MIPAFYVSQINPENEKMAIELLRDNFQSLIAYLKNEKILNNEFKHFEVTLDRAVTNYNFAHNFTFIPKDILQTFLTEGVTLTWKYDHFTRTHLVFTTSAACTVRFFAGRFKGD